MNAKVVTLVVLLGVVAMVLLRIPPIPALLVVGLLGAGTAALTALRPPTSAPQAITSEAKTTALWRRLTLVREDIATVLTAFEDFQYSPQASHLADRTLHRPALANPDSRDETIAEFHLHAARAQRYLDYLDAAAESLESPEDLSLLVEEADGVSVELAQSWHAARVRAEELGPSPEH